MKLYVTREQAKGLLGGVQFELAAKVELRPEWCGLGFFWTPSWGIVLR